MRVNAVWVDGSPGPIEQLALASWVYHGFEVRLWAYDEVQAPDGVEVMPASDVLCGPIERYTNGQHAGSPVLHANLFRYRYLARIGGAFIDTDTVCLRPFNCVGTFWSSERSGPNFAFVQAFPSLLTEWMWCEACHRLDDRTRGRFGPLLLKAALHKFKGMDDVCEPEAFCQFNWDRWRAPFVADPPELTGCGLHLWSSMVRRNGMDFESCPESSLWKQWQKRFIGA